MQLWSGGYNCDDLRNVLFFHMVLCQGKHLDHGVDMPLFVWSILLTDLANLIRKLLLELVVSTNQIVSQFFHN